MASSSQQSSSSDDLNARVRKGDREALTELFGTARPRLRRMVELRIGPELRQRVDASDVLQDTWLEASEKLDWWCNSSDVPFIVWLRLLAKQRLATLFRFHCGAQARDARRDLSLFGGGIPDASTEMLAAQLLGHVTTPSLIARRAELGLKLQEALNAMRPQERDILVLRHFEQLSNGEAAAELGIETSAASKRYLRAVMKLKTTLDLLGISPERTGGP